MPPHLALLDVSPMVTQPVPIFFIVLVIILTAPLLLNKLKIPHIIGMIVAGVVIGPHGFNVLAADESFSDSYTSCSWPASKSTCSICGSTCGEACFSA